MISEVYNEGYKFCQDMRIPCYETDAAFCLKPASFMDMAQEIAYWAAQALGFGYDDLQRHHTAWVLSRMHFHCETLPMWAEFDAMMHDFFYSKKLTDLLRKDS